CALPQPSSSFLFNFTLSVPPHRFVVIEDNHKKRFCPSKSLPSLRSYHASRAGVSQLWSSTAMYLHCCTLLVEPLPIHQTPSPAAHRIPPSVQSCFTFDGALATNPMFHARTKHIEIHVHFVCDQVLRDVLEVQYIPSTDQLVDNLNKPFTHSHFQCLRSKLGIIQLLSHLRGNIREKCHISNTHSSSPSPKSI
ncbi:hypothetical protein Csa_017512, partial [Cucumis sativus]